MIMLVAIPMVVQNGITNFVNLLDNIMVGQLGTEPMSGVAIANQLIFVFNLCIFGGISGAGIFSAQFHGAGNSDGVRQTFRFKLIVCATMCVLFLTTFTVFDKQLISMFLHQSESTGDLTVTLAEGSKYLRIMIIGLIPFAINQAYVGTLRETGETLLPMKAGIVAVFVNLTFNWLLIFGHLGFPMLGAEGAAIATVLSRFIEAFIVIGWTHSHSIEKPFIIGAYKGFKISRAISGRIIKKGWPLLLNEMLWSIGMTVITQLYSMRGLAAIAAINIASTLYNLFRVVLFASGNTIAIIVGNLLGAGKMDEARDTDNKLIATTVMLCMAMGLLLILIAPLFPKMYNTTDDVRAIAATLLRITGLFMPVAAFTSGCYFTLRSGGKTLITFVFDSMFVWVICIPPTFFAAKYTALSVVMMYAIMQSFDLIKATIGIILIKKGSWLTNMVGEHEAGQA